MFHGNIVAQEILMEAPPREDESAPWRLLGRLQHLAVESHPNPVKWPVWSMGSIGLASRLPLLPLAEHNGRP
jgi:hypothetical protein